MVETNFSYRTETKNSAFFSSFLKLHYSRTVKVTPPNSKLDLCFVALNIMYKFRNIRFRQTKIRKPIRGRTDERLYKRADGLTDGER